MKKRVCAALLICSIFMGLGFTVDFFLNTCAQTRFLMQGSTALRYILPLLLSAGIWLSGCMIPQEENRAVREGKNIKTAGALLATASAVCGFLILAETLFGEPENYGYHSMDAGRITLMRTASIVCGSLLIVYAVWNMLFLCENNTEEHSRRWFGLGIAGSFAFFLYALFILLVQQASIYRIGPTMEILAAMSALLFTTSLLRVSYRPDQAMVRALYRTGMSAFLFCTCIETPYAVWRGVNGIKSAVSFPFAVILCIIGVLGAFYACSTAGQKE